MGLINKEVEVILSGNNIKYYENLGYKILKRKDKKGRMTIPKGTKIKVKIEDLSKCSIARVNIQCNNCGKILKNIQWLDYLRHVHVDGKYYCNKCGILLIGSKKSNKTKLKNGKSFEEWCIENDRLDILVRWDYELNDCKPSEICYSPSNKKYWFKCPKGIHKSESKILSRLMSGNNKSMDCKACNSFAQWGIDNICSDFLEKYWDYEKNDKLGINPWKISYSSNKKVNIVCQEKDYHESYPVSCNSFIDNHRCPYCNKNSGKVHPLDSLGKLLEDRNLLGIWLDKNKKSPYEYTPKSGQKVWWRCFDGKHEDYYRKINYSNDADFRCPECVQERSESFLQEKVRLYLESLNDGKYIVLHENKCTLNPRNIVIPPNKRKTKMLRYDNEIIINNRYFFIEVMGEQHEINSKWHKLSAEKYGTTPQQELDYQIAKDKYKEQYVYNQGENYYYLAVWYYDFNKQNTYKQLINNKISETLNNILKAGEKNTK